MKLHVLGSESAGNCYLLVASNQTLIIEAGIKVKEVKKALGFDLGSVVGCLLTHQHMDHFKYAYEFCRAGIDVYGSAETMVYCPDSHRKHTINNGIIYTIGSFRVLSFPVPHDVPTIGFLISHPESGKIMFVTDAAYVPAKFAGLSTICIEVNYEDSILSSDRAVNRHMSLDTALSFIATSDLSLVRNIVLLHLSASNSDAAMFITKVKQVAPRADVHVADKGVEINISKHPF